MPGASVKIHPDHVLSAVQAAKQVALHGAAVYGLPYPLFFVFVPHGIFQYFFEHTLYLHLLCTHVAEVGAEIAAVGAPVLLLPADVTRRAVNQLIETRGVRNPFIDGKWILKFPVVFLCGFSARDAVRAKMTVRVKTVKGAFVINLGRLSAAITGKLLFCLAKHTGLQRMRVVAEKREFFLPLALFFDLCRCLRALDRKGIAPVFGVLLEASETL